jgi:hypothetical protein
MIRNDHGLSFSGGEVKKKTKEIIFQRELVRRLRKMFPGCIVIRNDPNFLQGIPDILLLWGRCWAALECKSSPKASVQPNQRHYIRTMNRMSFAAFVYPENKEQVLNALQHSFRPDR